MRNKRLIFIVGKTSSGKDTVAKYIRDNYNIPMLCSYSTAKQRPDQVEGVHHYFITPERMQEILRTENLLAYVKFPKTGVEYCATVEAMSSDTAVYIIDPLGIDWFKNNCRVDGLSYFSIYIDLPESIIIKRAINRGGGIDSVKERLSSERDVMNSFKVNKMYDYIIDNSGSYNDLVSCLTSILSMEGI